MYRCVVDQYGAPVTNASVMLIAPDEPLKQTDSNGIWTGKAPRKLGRLMIATKPPAERHGSADYHMATYTLTDEPTNRVTVTLPAAFCR